MVFEFGRSNRSRCVFYIRSFQIFLMFEQKKETVQVYPPNGCADDRHKYHVVNIGSSVHLHFQWNANAIQFLIPTEEKERKKENKCKKKSK